MCFKRCFLILILAVSATSLLLYESPGPAAKSAESLVTTEEYRQLLRIGSPRIFDVILEKELDIGREMTLEEIKAFFETDEFKMIVHIRSSIPPCMLIEKLCKSA